MCFAPPFLNGWVRKENMHTTNTPDTETGVGESHMNSLVTDIHDHRTKTTHGIASIMGNNHAIPAR